MFLLFILANEIVSLSYGANARMVEGGANELCTCIHIFCQRAHDREFPGAPHLEQVHRHHIPPSHGLMRMYIYFDACVCAVPRLMDFLSDYQPPTHLRYSYPILSRGCTLCLRNRVVYSFKCFRQLGFCLII